MKSEIQIRVTTRRKPDSMSVEYNSHTRVLTLIEEQEDCYYAKDQTGMERVVLKDDKYFDLLKVEFLKREK